MRETKTKLSDVFIESISKIWVQLLLAALVAFSLFPIAWAVISSLKTRSEIFTTPPTFFPTHVTFENFFAILTELSFPRYFLNSALVISMTVLIAVTFSCLAGYGFSRFKFVGHGSLLTFLLTTQMLPSVLMAVPYFVVMKTYGLINTYPALILAFLSFTAPVATWIMKGFIDSIPTAIDEAALIDGCTRVQAFFKVIFPLIVPGIAAVTIYVSILAWNDFIFSLTLITSEEMRTVSLAVGLMLGVERCEWGYLMAGAVAASVPMVILYLILQKFLVKGLTAGAVKQ